MPDGNICFIGRSDYQVKVRGFRIELGEIEAWLEQHPAVQQAVVLVRQDELGNKILAAYVVTLDPQRLNPTNLHQFLQDRLPSYMLPTTWMVLKNFPLTTNGKVDRRALPAPTPALREPAVAVAPADELERQLIQIWEAVLGVQPVQPDDNFFEIGGHSLLSIQLFVRIEQAIGRSLPPTSIFQAPTVKSIAALLRQSVQQSPTHSAIVIQEGKLGQPPLFCIHVLRPEVSVLSPLGGASGASPTDLWIGGPDARS